MLIRHSALDGAGPLSYPPYAFKFVTSLSRFFRRRSLALAGLTPAPPRLDATTRPPRTNFLHAGRFPFPCFPCLFRPIVSNSSHTTPQASLILESNQTAPRPNQTHSYSPKTRMRPPVPPSLSRVSHISIHPHVPRVPKLCVCSFRVLS